MNETRRRRARTCENQLVMSTVDLREGMESLEYWRDRSRRLAWYRLGARREAKEMASRWEMRVRDAALRQRGVAFGARVAAGLLLARIWVPRLRFRRAVLLVTGVALALMSLPLILTVPVLTQIF